MYLFRREQRPLPPPASYIIQPQVDAQVERLQAGQLRVSWTAVADSVKIFIADSPSAPLSNDPVVEVTGVQEICLDVWDTAVQPTFQLHFLGGAADGQQLFVAERTLALQRGVNFRDIGGYLTQNGRRVRWGKVYRSGYLSKLTPADVDVLANLNLQVVCDFRSKYETEHQPDRLPTNPAPTYLSLPALSVVSRWRQFLGFVHYRNRLGDLLLRGYIDVMLEENAALMGTVLQQVADSKNLPLLVHCTAGKDRTGICVALLLALLGVDDETIIADYSLSNAYYNYYAPILQKDIRQLTRLGFSDAQVRPIMLADPAIMQKMLNYVRAQYGSIFIYAQKAAGIDEITLNKIRDNLLY